MQDLLLMARLQCIRDLGGEFENLARTPALVARPAEQVDAVHEFRGQVEHVIDAAAVHQARHAWVLKMLWGVRFVLQPFAEQIIIPAAGVSQLERDPVIPLQMMRMKMSCTRSLVRTLC